VADLPPGNVAARSQGSAGEDRDGSSDLDACDRVCVAANRHLQAAGTANESALTEDDRVRFGYVGGDEEGADRARGARLLFEYECLPSRREPEKAGGTPRCEHASGVSTIAKTSQSRIAIKALFRARAERYGATEREPRGA
jgi:hypothetical protein